MEVKDRLTLEKILEMLTLSFRSMEMGGIIHDLL
jgi:hypothetical protein